MFQGLDRKIFVDMYYATKQEKEKPPEKFLTVLRIKKNRRFSHAFFKIFSGEKRNF